MPIDGTKSLPCLSNSPCGAPKSQSSFLWGFELHTGVSFHGRCGTGYATWHYVGNR